MKMSRQQDAVYKKQRRSFIKCAGISSLGLGLLPILPRRGRAAAEEPYRTTASWKNDSGGNRYFTTKTLRTDRANDAGNPTVTAKVDGLWKKYDVRPFSNEFHDWWIEEKIWYYDQLIAYFEDETDELAVPNGGHHHPMLSTYGRRFWSRNDSDFHLNCAVKGFTIIPKPDKIAEVNNKIQEVYDAVAAGEAKIPVDIFKARQAMYQQKDLWDTTRFATLELYSGRPINEDDSQGGFGFKETKTFQNIVVNPMATLTYMALYNTDGTQNYMDGLPELTPHFQFRGFCWLISYYNPGITEYEKTIADYINQAHCGYHGGACDIATNIFLISEQFNETPSYDGGRGKRVVPDYTYQSDFRTRDTVTIRPERKLSVDEKLALLKRLRIPV